MLNRTKWRVIRTKVKGRKKEAIVRYTIFKKDNMNPKKKDN